MYMKLSIITINYNNRDGLQKTIDSVICQTWRDFEWIVIDGGSTDGSRELIEKYQDHFTYWCSEPDKGIYNAMNKGVSHAKGEYVIFMNSGDCFYGGVVLAKVFKKVDGSGIVTGLVVRKDNNELLRTYDDNLVIQLLTDTLNHQGTFIKRSLLQMIKYDENLKVVADWKFWIETIIFHDTKVQIINDVIAIQDVTGISSINQSLLFDEREKVKRELIPNSISSIVNDYNELRKTIIYRRVVYLKRHHLWLYSIIRQLLAVILLCVGVDNKKLLESEKSNNESFCH